MRFDYMIQTIVGDSIDIDDIGNVALQMSNDRGEFWYLVIKTELGWTEIFEFGPVVPDIEQLPKSCALSYNRIEYKQGKIEDIIDKSINNGYRGITQVCEITKEEAKNNMRNLVSYI